MKYAHEKIIIGCGVWLMVLPFTGFPRSFKTFLTIITGLALVYVGAILLKRIREEKSEIELEVRTGTFKETMVITEQ